MRAVNLLGLLSIGLVASIAGVAACVGDETTSPGDAGTGGNSDGSIGPADSDGGGGSNDSSADTATGNDTGSGADADAGTPPLDVRTIPGLRLWLESTQGLTKATVGTDFVSWRDSSGRWADGGAGVPEGGAHTAYPIPFNNGGAVYPSVVANGIGGRASVSFQVGPKIAIPNHADFEFGTGDWVIATVAAVTSGTGPMWNLMTASTAPSGTSLDPTEFCSFRGGLGAQPQCTTPPFTPSTAPHVFVARRKTAQAIFRVDGTSRGTYDYGVNNPDLSVLTFQQANAIIGGNVVTQLAEVIVIIGTMSDANLDTLETHLKTKYAIP